MLTLLLISISSLAFNIQPAKAELGTWTRDDELANLHKIQEATNNVNPEYTLWPSIKNWLMRANESDLTNRLTVRAMDDFRASLSPPYGWSLPNKMEWSEFAYIHDDSAELVIGLDEIRSNSYPELLDLIVGDSGKLVNTVSMDGRVAAVVADIPLEVTSVFVSKVEISRLSRYIEPNVRFQVDFTPNDPYWSLQWGPQKIEADWAWNTTTGNSSVIVAVVDTGIDYTHPDLAANYAPLGYDWVNNDPDPMDDFGHGTHVAGTIAAVINNGIGIAGLAKVRIMAEKVMDASGSGSLSDVVRGIVHAVDRGAKIINLSLGSYVKSELLHEAVKYAHDHGVLVVASAGNDATSVKSYPAAYDEVVAVSATDEFDKPAAFSNYGDWVDVAAPGVKIYSTMPTYHVTMNNNGFNLNYDYMSGTSMACPHVVGVAALIWSQFPDMTRDQVLAQLQYSADDLGELGFDVYYGFGRVNAMKAVEQAPTGHDVLVLNLKTPSYVSLGKVAVINTTVLNMGTNHESDITVRLLVNGSVVNSTTIDFLMSGASTAVSFSWNATIEGMHNVTSYVVPVMGETIVGNNVLSKQIKVRLPQVIRVPDNYGTIQGAIDAANEGDTVSVASGTYYGNVWINKEGLTLVGEDIGNTIIDGNGMYDVVDVSADDVQISRFTIRNSGKITDYYPPPSGILVYSSEGTAISNTVLLNNLMGICIFCSSDTTLRNNNMTCNTYNFEVDGDGLGDFIHSIDASNTVDGKPIYYWVNEHDKQVPSDAGYVAVVNSTNIAVKDLNLTKNFEGVLFACAVNSSIENVNASDNHYGIYLAYSDNNVVHGNTATNNYVGIYLYESETNNVDDNMLMDNEKGIDLYCSKDNTVNFSKLLNNDFGLLLEKSNSNTVFSNKALNNTYGINIQRSCYNTFRDNNMTTNEYNFGVIGNHLSHLIQDMDISNTVDGKPIYYWVNQKDREIPTDAGYVAVINSTNITAKDLNLTNNVQGVLFAFTAESLIENVKAINNTYGIYLYSSSNNTIVDNTVTSKGERGVQLVNSNNNTISNNLIANNYIGIGLSLSSENNTINWNAVLNGTSGGVGLYLDGSNSNTIGNNAITNNYDGIILYQSSTNTLRNNNMTNNSYNFGADGVSLSHYINDVDTSNTVNGKPIYYWINQHDKQVPTNAGYVAIVNSTGVIAKNLDLSKNEQGILFAYTTDSTIMNVTASYNYDGIYLWRSDSSTIIGNKATKNEWDGIDLYYSDNNTIAHNTVTDDGTGIDATVSHYNNINSNVASRNIVGIYLYEYSDNNIVIGNKVTGGEVPEGLVGICLTEATGNVISENMVSENQFLIGAGIYLELSSNDNTIIKNKITNNYYGLSIGYQGLYGLKDQNNNNTIYHNNLIENTKQVLSLNSINTWDNGYHSGGNYWSDYTGLDLYRGPYQNETGSDEIGDTPHVIDAKNRDRYPLMKPWTHLIGDVNGDDKVDIKDLVLLIKAFGTHPTHPRWNPNADINCDGKVDIKDLVLIIKHFGQHYP